MKNFISILDHDLETLQHVFDVAFKLRDERQAGVKHQPILDNQSIAIIFEKPSLRTWVSFEVGIHELGGHPVTLGSDVGLGKRETPADVARVLEGMVSGIIARVFEHDKLTEMTNWCKIPVINALSDDSHPCQAMADAMTIMDAFGRDLIGRKVAFIGDGNNTAKSLAAICAQLGMKFTLAAPEGYEFDPSYVSELNERFSADACKVTRDSVEAVSDADVVYTDTWVSMGQESEAEIRRNVFADYKVDADLVKQGPDQMIVMHDLPAYRGYEITDEVMDGPRSRVFPQSHNRLHAQKGLLAVLYGGL